MNRPCRSTLLHGLAGESVSGHHGEIHLSVEGIRLRDLGSLNGTWIGGSRIEETPLEAGQAFHMGLVQLVLRKPVLTESVQASTHDQPVGAAASGDAAEVVAETPYCDRCRSWLRSAAASVRLAGAATRHVCPQWGNAYGPRTDGQSALNGSKEPSSFSGVIGAFAYPVATDSGARLLGGALALTLMGYVARFGGFAVVVIPVGPVILVMAAILAMGLAGYLFEFVKNVVATSAGGDERMPGWPEATSPAALVRPFLQLVTLVLFCFGPATLWVWVIRNPNWGGVWIPAGLAVAASSAPQPETTSRERQCTRALMAAPLTAPAARSNT